MNKKLFIIILIIAILFLSGGYYLYQNKGNIFGKKVVSDSSLPNILFFTNPVTNFTGKIDKISDNFIWISQKYTITPPPLPPNAPTMIPGQTITVPPLPPSKMFTYKVNIAPFTLISKPDAPVVYLFKKVTPTPTPIITIKDARVGQIVSVVSSSDLRTLKTEEFDAYSLKLPPMVNTITGKITSINIIDTKDSIIILKAIQPVQPGDDQPTVQPPKEIEYSVSITQDTEISRMSKAEIAKAGITPKPAQPVKYQITDLKQDMQITVYSDTDVIENHKLRALRIEPPADLVTSSK